MKRVQNHRRDMSAGKGLYRARIANDMEVQQRCVIEFLTDEVMPGDETISRLRKHYGEKALSRTQVDFWINEVKRGRTDPNILASPGREPDEGLATVIQSTKGAFQCLNPMSPKLLSKT
jgi:hypothetical protein